MVEHVVGERTGSHLLRQVANVGSILYPLLMIFAKASILLLYHRIFRPSNKVIWAIYATLALVIGYNVSVMFAAVWECTPRKKSWDITATGTCIDILGLAIAGGTFNVFTDLVILILPMPMVWNLRLPLRQKIAVTGIFATGAL